MGLQTPSTPLVLSLTSPLVTLCSVQWLVENIHLYICQALVEPFRRQLYQALVNRHLLASKIVSRLVTVYRMDLQVGQSLGSLSFSLYYVLCLCISSHWYFVPPSNKDQSIHTLVFLLFELCLVCELYLVYSELQGYLSVRTYHVCSSVTGLPHTGYFLVLSICVRIS